jgi:hypothetical protein
MYCGSLSNFLRPSLIFVPLKCFDPMNLLRVDPLNSFLPIVGNQQHSVTDVMQTEGTRWDTVPLRIVPERGKVPENSAHRFVSKQTWDVLNKCEPGSNLPKKPGIFAP